MEESLCDFTFDIRSSYFLNSHIMILVEIDPPKNLAKAALPNLLIQIKHIILYLLHQFDWTLFVEHHLVSKK